MDYYSYVIRMAVEAKRGRTDEDWAALIPTIIDYAEQRIYRDLDVLRSRITSTSGTFNSSSRTFTLPSSQGTFIMVETMNAVSASTARTQMVPVTKEFIDAVYPNTSSSVNGTPQYFAPITDQVFAIGPAADTTYSAEVTGVVRPTALSSGNTTTFLTTYCPDLFMAASLVFASDAATRPFWEDQYSKLMMSAGQEQLRSRFEGAAWTPMIPAPVQPPRV